MDIIRILLLIVSFSLMSSGAHATVGFGEKEKAIAEKVKAYKEKVKAYKEKVAAKAKEKEKLFKALKEKKKEKIVKKLKKFKNKPPVVSVPELSGNGAGLSFALLAACGLMFREGKRNNINA